MSPPDLLSPYRDPATLRGQANDPRFMLAEVRVRQSIAQAIQKGLDGMLFASALRNVMRPGCSEGSGG